MPVGSTAGGQVPSASSAMRRCSEAHAACGGSAAGRWQVAAPKRLRREEPVDYWQRGEDLFVRGRTTGDWRSARHATCDGRQGRDD